MLTLGRELPVRNGVDSHGGLLLLFLVVALAARAAAEIVDSLALTWSVALVYRGRLGSGNRVDGGLEDGLCGFDCGGLNGCEGHCCARVATALGRDRHLELYCRLVKGEYCWRGWEGEGGKRETLTELTQFYPILEVVLHMRPI